MWLTMLCFAFRHGLFLLLVACLLFAFGYFRFLSIIFRGMLDKIYELDVHITGLATLTQL